MDLFTHIHDMYDTNVEKTRTRKNAIFEAFLHDRLLIFDFLSHSDWIYRIIYNKI